MMDEAYDIAVIGAGMAGTSAAAYLADNHKVILLEQEEVPAYHTTGRSAAVFAPCYGPTGIRALTRASESFLIKPPSGFTSGALTGARSILLIARDDQLPKLDEELASVGNSSNVTRLQQSELLSANRLLRGDYAVSGLLDTQGLDIDVSALHQGFLRRFQRSGGILKTNGRVESIVHHQGKWRLALTGNLMVTANIIVNAAGAWADVIAQLAGVKTIGLVPKRRTALMIETPEGIDTKKMPITIDIEEQFYLKPEGSQLLISPADETPSPPCDAQPEDIDVAICIDRISKSFDVDIKRPLRQWAGLRSFVSDGEPVVGFDENAEGFFWLAGQGGYGIQTAPAMAQLSASIITGEAVPEHISRQGLDVDSLKPRRAQK